MEIKELSRKQKNTKPAAEVEEMIKKLRKEHSVMKKGMFEFLDAQGGWLDFTYRFFKDDPIFTIRLVHGEVCELPMGLIKHLNNTYKKVRQMGQMDASGKKLPDVVAKTSRVRFTPMDVM